MQESPFKKYWDRNEFIRRSRTMDRAGDFRHSLPRSESGYFGGPDRRRESCKNLRLKNIGIETSSFGEVGPWTEPATFATPSRDQKAATSEDPTEDVNHARISV